MIEEVIKTGVKKSLYYSGLYRARRAIQRLTRPGSRLLILVYHQLTDDTEITADMNHWYQIRPPLHIKTFASHMRILKNAYPVVSLEECAEQLCRGELQRDSVAVTFDDAYASFKKLASPVLRDLGLPATVFVPTDFVESGRIFWWDELAQVVNGLAQEGVSESDLQPVVGSVVAHRLAGSRGNFRLASECLSAIETSIRYQTQSTQLDTVQRLRRLLPQGTQSQLQPEPLMTWSDMRELSRCCISFQSHTCSHPGVAHASKSEIERELIQSRAMLENHVGSQVTALAYPYGGDIESYRRNRDVLRSLGYTCARTTRPGFNDSSTDPLLLNGGGIGESVSPSIVRRDLALQFLD